MKIGFPKLKRYELYAAIFSFLYLLFFAFYFFNKRNDEFVFYVIALFLLYFVFLFNIRKFNLSPFVLWGFVLVGFMHMFGGAIYIFGERLYDVLSFGLINLGGEFVLIKYDQIVHFMSTFLISVALFEIVSQYMPDFKKIKKYSYIYLLIIFCAFGIAAFNEIVEFVPGYFWGDSGVGGYVNTILDLCFNFLGAIFGMFFVARFRIKKEKS